MTNVHSLWNYFYYMYTLENLKHITEFTGIEYWINRQIKIPFIVAVATVTRRTNIDDIVGQLTNCIGEWTVLEEGFSKKAQVLGS